MPPNSDRPPPLLLSNLYALLPTDPSYHPDVKNLRIHSPFEVGESSAHSNSNVQASSGIAQQQLEGLRQQTAALEAALGTTSNIFVPIYSENPVNSFPNLSSPYATNTMAQSLVYHLSREKLNEYLFLMVSVSEHGP